MPTRTTDLIPINAESSVPTPDASTADYARSISRRIHALTLFILLAALIGFSLFAMQAFETRMAPEIGKKSATIGRILAAQIERAVGYGIPFAKLVGMGPFLASVFPDNPEVAYLLVADATGAILYAAGPGAAEGQAALAGSSAAMPHPEDAIPIRSVGTFYDTALIMKRGDNPIGALHIGVRQSFVRGQLAEIIYDVLTVLVVALLVAFEMVAVLVALRVARPMARAERLLERLRCGDFRYDGNGSKGDEVGRFTAALAAVTRRVNERYWRLVQEAEEIKAGQIDPGIVARIEAAMSRLNARFSFPAPGASLISLREPSLASVRGPLFLFVLAEELSRSFMPLYIHQLYAANPMVIPGLSEDVIIGLPIALFMLCIAVTTPIAGQWADRWGTRRLFIAALLPGLVGAIGTALAGSVLDLLWFRSLSAIGYAMATIACQGYIAQTAPAGGRARAMAVFIGSIMLAAICGAAIGGVLADRIGYRATFLIGAGMIPLAAALLLALLDEPERLTKSAPNADGQSGWRAFRALLGNPRFVALMLGSAIPAKMILTGFLFFLAPLYLRHLGYETATGGRVMMSYFVLMILLGPLAARWADRSNRHRSFVILGGVLSGTGVFSVLYWNDLWAVLAGVTALGLGQALLTAPTLALIPEISARECQRFGQATVLGALRVIERIGSVAGPLLAAWVLGQFGYAGSAASSGVIVIAGSVLLGLVLLALGDGRRTATARGLP